MKKNIIKGSTIYLTFLVFITISSCVGNKNNPPSLDNSKVRVVKTKKLSIAQTLTKNNHLPVEERIAMYHQLKKENPDGYNFENEDELTMYGYSFLWDNNVAEAIEIFKLIVEQFPNSSNPYDSLGESYLANGDNELSLVNYKKSLELNPDNFNAEDQIEHIKFPNKKEETPAERFVKIFTEKEYKDDLDQLGKTLAKVHPEAFKFISEDDFWNIIEKKKALITETTTYGNFIWHCSEIIASINCSHTSLGGFNQESVMLGKALVFPLQTLWINNQLFVIDQMSNTSQIKLKDEILSINGQSVSELVNEIYNHIQSQGNIETSKRHFFNSWSTEIIPFMLGFPESYIVKVKGRDNPIVLNKAKTFKAPYKDSSLKKCDDDLCLEFMDANKTAVLTISSFNYYSWNNLDVYEDFIAKSFKEIKEKGSENMIIDLRFNGGGSPESSIYLLKYLVDKPFVYFTKTEYPRGKGSQDSFENAFKGKLFFIIDGHGKSTTGHFMAIAKDLELGTIVGEELGSNQFCTAGQTVCRLKSTKLKFNVANTTSRVAVISLPDDRGILPDYNITQSIEDYINNVDVVKEYTIEIIKK